MGRASATGHEADATGSAPAPAAALLAAILETAEDGIVGLAPDRTIAFANQAAARYFGRPAADMVGERAEALFPADQRPTVAGLLERVSAGDRVRQYETEVLRGDGMPVPLALSLSPVAAGTGPPGAVLVARDITEQRLAQAALAEVEARVRASEALAHVGSWLWDLRTGVVQWSDELHRIHGVDPLDFGGTLEAHLAVVHPDDRAALRAAMDEAVASGRGCDTSYRIVRPDARVRTLHARAEVTTGSGGAVVGLRGIGRDVTAEASGGISPAR